MMKVFKEKMFFGLTGETADEHSGFAILENGEWILIHENGTAVGSDGRKYARVSEEVPSRPMPKDELLQYVCTSIEDFDEEPPETFPIPDTDLRSIGWTCDADKPVVVCVKTETDGQTETL